MTLFALEIPDNPARLPGWLEDHLLGLHLRELVAELSAAHGAGPSQGPSVRQLFGNRLAAVLEGGLGELPPHVLRELLVRPCLLLELQELVLTEGGPYWDQAGEIPAPLQERVDRGRERLRRFLSEGRSETPSTLLFRPSPQKVVWYRRPWVVSLATAAAVLLAVFSYQTAMPPRVGPSAVAWGWNKPDAVAKDVPPADYLNQLANAADEWFRERPGTPADLAQRIAELRQGCSRLILAEHKPLAAEDQDWLKKKCSAWAEKFDKQLAAVEAGQDVLQVRKEVDDTVNKLMDALRKLAKERATG